MVSKRQQEHLKALLTEAITVLCKNGLGFEAQLNIEALIGITVDKEEVFLVNVNETVNARNINVSSVIELSCEDVCQRECPTLEPQINIQSGGQGSPKRSRIHKRKHSNSSSNNDMPPKLEKITKTEVNTLESRGDPTEKRVLSGNCSPVDLQELNKTQDSREQLQADQDFIERKCEDQSMNESNNKKSRDPDNSSFRRNRKKSNTQNVDRHRSGEEGQGSNEQEASDSRENPQGSNWNSEQEIETSSTSVLNSSKTTSTSSARSSHYKGSPSNIENLKSASEQVAYLHTTETRLQAVQYAEAVGNRAAGRAFGVSEGLIRKWRKTKDELIAAKTALI